ncbi:hypothetical protein DAEQUDRAFT_680220, partial [Daedalea quercina L-15889]
DGDLRADWHGHTVLYCVLEVKNEVCTTRSDAFVEAIHYWLEQVRLVRNAYRRPRGASPSDEFEKLNFPVILIMHFGPYLAIAIATFADVPNIEHLTCIPSHVHPTNTKEQESGARAIAALRIALHDLHRRYPGITSACGPRGNFPFRDFYDDADGRWYFSYKKALEDRRVFLFEGKDDGEHEEPLLVKFSKCYCTEAHLAAHRSGFAPKVYAVNDVFDWIMVVMSAEYTNLWELKTNGDPRGAMEGMHEDVRSGLAKLHEAGYVHGDVRDVNVLVRTSGGGPKVLLVDWDWVGKASDAMYPFNMNCKSIGRPQDALPGSRIKTEHDMWMADRLLSLDT